MNFEINLTFKSAGHGTFFVGQIKKYTTNANTNEIFTWVYDCGSQSKINIKNIINNCNYNEIDFLALSHFDSDHINGVETLIKKFKVKYLILPYMDLFQRFSQLNFTKNSLIEKKDLNCIIEPLNFLFENNLFENVQKIILIDGNNEINNEINNFDFNDINMENLPKLKNNEDKYFSNDNYEIIKEKMCIVNHNTNFFVNKIYKFKFFNPINKMIVKNNNNLIKFNNELSKIVDEIFKVPTGNKRNINNYCSKKIKDHYEEYFGKTSKRKNDISLCLYSKIGTIDDCFINCCYTSLNYKNGLLLLGDLSISNDVIAYLKKHLGENFKSLFAVQVPHHGSDKSWLQGAANSFNPTYFVNCVPDNSSKFPGPKVKADLKNFNVLTSNYSNAVQFKIFYNLSHNEFACCINNKFIQYCNNNVCELNDDLICYLSLKYCY